MSDATPPSADGDRSKFGRALVIAGSIGVAGALLAGTFGWILTGRVGDSIAATVEPVADIVVDLADAIDASLVMVERTTEAIESIEGATRSTGRALTDVADVVVEVSNLTAGDVASGLDSAIATLPSLIDTGRVIDRTMTALSFVGVDYDPEVPLDVALQDLETSLAPLPDQLRSQLELMDAVATDLGEIAVEAGSLSAVLLQTRIDMLDAERVLRSAAANAALAAGNVEEIEADISAFSSLARLAIVAATVALIAAASAPLMIGLHYRRTTA